LTLALLVYIAQQLVFMLKPTVPFSEPRTRGRQGMWLGLAFVLGPLGGVFALMLISRGIYVEPARLPVFYAIMLMLILAFDRILIWRIRRKFTLSAQPSSMTSIDPATLQKIPASSLH
jgi:hypothetical protein